jgi:uncharacterized protein (UPF0276 family)
MTHLAAGLGFKPLHLQPALAARQPGLWFEVHAENYMVDGGPRPRLLDALAAVHPVSLHGVSMSLAGAEPPDPDHLRRFAALVARVRPVRVSEHLAWSRLGARYEPDLLPFVRDAQSLQRVVDHVQIVQEAIGRPLAVENPSHYLAMAGHTWDEVDFLCELVRRSGCQLLVDVANVHLSGHNLGFAAEDWLDRLPADAVAEVHLAGHSADPRLGDALWIDSHDAPVHEGAWALYRRLMERIGPRPTLIEWDGRLPAFEALLAEADQARRILDTVEAVS